MLHSNYSYQFVVANAICCHYKTNVKPNKETVMIRKRGPGGGRKPRGEFKGKTATLTTRITTETRQALDNAAKKNSRSLSQEVERRLRDSLRGDARGKPHVRALGEAFMLMVQGVERATDQHWREDAFTAEALSHGLSFLISHFGPDGPPTVPKKIEETPGMLSMADTPAKLGRIEAGSVISLVERWNLEELGEITKIANRRTDVPTEWFRHSQLLRDLGSGWERRRSRQKEKGR
jgi:hypothetical protein